MPFDPLSSRPATEDGAAAQYRTREAACAARRDAEAARSRTVSNLRLVTFLAGAEVDADVDFMAVSSYAGTASTGTIRVLLDLRENPEGRDVLVVEDIVDTGLTLHYLARTFRLRAPRSLAAVTFLDRPYRRLVDDLPVRYVGFTVPDEFFAGYGFDLDERWRNLPDLHLVT